MGYGTINIGYQPKPEKTVLTLTHSKSGTIHTLAGLPEGFGLFTAQFKATADFVAGDTFAGGYTAKPTGEETALPDKAFISGDLVTVSVDKTRKMLYFAVGISGDFLPLEGGTMTGPAVGAPGAISTPQFRNIQYGTEALTPGVSPLPQGTLYITPEANGANWEIVYNTPPIRVYSNGVTVLVMTISDPPFPSSYTNYEFGGINYKRGTASTGDIIPEQYRPISQVTQYFRTSTDGIATEISITQTGGVLTIVTAPYLTGSEESPKLYWGSSQQVLAVYPIIKI